MLAGLLYLGSGVGAGLIRLGVRFRLRRGQPGSRLESPLRRSDLPWLAGALLAGGVAGPVLLLAGLSLTPAATASLLLNFEAVATTLLAALLFGEAVGRRVWVAVGLITLGSILLSLNLTGQWGFTLGALAVLGACLLWGLDNNLTRNVSAKDPLAIVTFKGLGAGAFSFGLSLLFGQALPAPGVAGQALLLGAASYGLSIALFVLALRCLGAARSGALFGAAPFLGAGLSFLIFRERLGWTFYLALPLMAAGLLALLGEQHAHLHAHLPYEHDHLHAHPEEHHTHPHRGALEPPPGAHAHLHSHSGLQHAHPHTPDLHHRHDHLEE
jgi:drug/metabolite transporter (DMT)-like permease